MAQDVCVQAIIHLLVELTRSGKLKWERCNDDDNIYYVADCHHGESKYPNNLQLRPESWHYKDQNLVAINLYISLSGTKYGNETDDLAITIHGHPLLLKLLVEVIRQFEPPDTKIEMNAKEGTTEKDFEDLFFERFRELAT